MKRKHYEKHGLSDTPEYQAWADMIVRCTNPKNRRFKDYGGRGITVCDKWRRSFLSFLDDVGKRPEARMSLDRENNSGNYEPGNVRWAMPLIQAANRRTNHLLMVGGITMTVSEWARIKGIHRSTIFYRLSENWPAESLFATPERKYSYENTYC